MEGQEIGRAGLGSRGLRESDFAAEFGGRQEIAGGAGAEYPNWIASLDPVAECTVCATLDTNDLYMETNLDWITDKSLLGGDLSQRLRTIHRNRTPAAKQFFVSLAPGVLNPVFDNELSYQGLKAPDAGHQILALFRFWNMVQYFYPNPDVMADDPATSPDYWNNVLEESIPGVALAKSSLSYQQELMKFIARIHDTHANLWSSIAARPPIGGYLLVDGRFIEGKPLLIRYTSVTAGPASGLKPGDVIEQLDGVTIDDLVTQWRPIYADSNEAARFAGHRTIFDPWILRLGHLGSAPRRCHVESDGQPRARGDARLQRQFHP